MNLFRRILAAIRNEAPSATTRRRAAQDALVAEAEEFLAYAKALRLLDLEPRVIDLTDPERYLDAEPEKERIQ